ncbi:MAG: HEAT repeat domain-containing protein, partial [Holophagales bacterium]|nr:HEAT repeat domain-containing protein [Holophagales bacterium]
GDGVLDERILRGLLSENRTTILSAYSRIPKGDRRKYVKRVEEALFGSGTHSRVAALVCLATIPNEARRSHLIQALEDRSVSVRRRAIFFLGESRSKEVLRNVTGLMNDSNPDIRSAAREAYRKITGRRGP